MAQVEERVQKLLECIFLVHQEGEMDCVSCANQFECLVEMVAKGANLADVLPAIDAHLRCCPDCREEFEACVAILRAENSGLLTETNE
jgi:predicted anti-sigma-YlaC factor YlaD